MGNFIRKILQTIPHTSTLPKVFPWERMTRALKHAVRSIPIKSMFLKSNILPYWHILLMEYPSLLRHLKPNETKPWSIFYQGNNEHYKNQETLYFEGSYLEV